jgi:hypothetical protein
LALGDVLFLIGLTLTIGTYVVVVTTKIWFLRQCVCVCVCTMLEQQAFFYPRDVSVLEFH